MSLFGVWRTFIQLSASRGSSGFGYPPITFQDIQAFESVMQVKLTRFEIDIILELDTLYLKTQNMSA